MSADPSGVSSARVSVVIPAFNEGATVGASVSAAVGHPLVDEVIVVDDGSSDGSAAAAARAGARVIRLAGNSGKATALDAGVSAARNDTLLFLDADVTGHTQATLTRIIQPVLDGRVEMFVGVHARRTLWLNRLLHVFPIIGGDRALTRRLWDAVPAGHKRGFEIEIAMNHTAKRFPRRMGHALIRGLTHQPKERKYGLLVGLWRRLVMLRDIVRVTFRLYILGASS
ncbi:MAG TPA: glycosyltransferase [Gemmatimonadaceae bacterium]|nr:glycosyltransferase [Gemmatimonadaceae bacterium]